MPVVSGVVNLKASVSLRDWNRLEVTAEVDVVGTLRTPDRPYEGVIAMAVHRPTGSTASWTWTRLIAYAQGRSYTTTGAITGLSENTSYDIHVLACQTEPYNAYGWFGGDPAVWGSGAQRLYGRVDLGSVSTTQRPNPQSVAAAPARTHVDLRAYVSPKYDGALHWRLYADTAPTTVLKSGSVQTGNKNWVTWQVSGLTQNRGYMLQASRDSSFATRAAVSFTTLNVAIAGVTDPSAEMGQFANLWRRTLGLADFDMRTGQLPAGYADPQLADAPVEMRVSDMLTALAHRCSALPLERSDGSWRLLRRDMLEFCELGSEPAQTVDYDRHLVLEDTDENARAEAAVTAYSFKAWGGQSGDAVVTVGNRLDDPATAAQYGDRTADVPGQFVFVVQIPQALDAVRAEVAAGPPTVLDLRLTGHNDGRGLWAAQPGDCVAVDSGGERRLCVLLSRGVRFAPAGLGEHRLRCWVVAAGDRPQAAGGTGLKLLWESGGDVELEDGSAVLLEG